jgi:hypothetical protein
MPVADEPLMPDYAAGDMAAFDALYERHRGTLYRYRIPDAPWRRVRPR